MKINRESRTMAKKLYNASLSAGIIDEVKARKIVSYLVEHKPRNYFPILNRLKKLLSLKLAESKALVESAGPLGSGEKEISDRIKKSFGSHVSISFTQNPELLGGLRVTVGSEVWDGSIQTRLKNLENSF